MTIMTKIVMILEIMKMNLMMKIKIAISQPIFRLGAPDFAWYSLYLVSVSVTSSTIFGWLLLLLMVC